MSDKINFSYLFWLAIEGVGITRWYDEEAAPAYVLLDAGLDFIDERICEILC